MSVNQLAVETFSAIEDGAGAASIARLVDELFNASVDRRDDNWPSVQMHPLGFLAVIWPIDQFRVLRLHFWSQDFDWAQPGDLQIHDHTFDFSSVVLSGQIRNDVYSVEDDSRGYALYLTSYAEGSSRLSPQKVRVTPILESSQSHSSGTLYRMPSGVLHRTVLESTDGLTVLATRYRSLSRDGARVIGPALDSSVVFQRATFDENQLAKLLLSVRDALRRVLDHAGE